LRKGKSFGCDCPAKVKINTFREAARDILIATAFLLERSNELKFDPGKIILVGSSAGAEAVLNTAFMQYHHDFKELPYKNIKYAGLVSFAGALLDVNYITDDNKIPILLFHGEKDNLVPFTTAPHHYCAPGTPGYLILEGAKTIADRMRELNESYQLMYDPDGNHDWANIPYARVETVSEFIRATVLEGQNIQSRISTKSKD
ncbi:MAG: alpha/beta hydrolase, partial [Flavobacteriaceae bacterium]